MVSNVPSILTATMEYVISNVEAADVLIYPKSLLCAVVPKILEDTKCPTYPHSP